MKKLILMIMVLVSGVIFAKGEPELEVVGQLVKATYYFENGAIQQVGYFKNGKLDGKWMSYNENGSVHSIAEYVDGKKSGNWQFYDNSYLVKEIIYSDNSVVAIKDFNNEQTIVKN